MLNKLKRDLVGLEDLLEHNILENFPSELDELSSHTRLNEVTDLAFENIALEGDTIFIKGSGELGVELQCGSDNDQARGDGVKINDNFPFDFELILEYNDEKKLQISEVKKLKIDTSSFFE
jgi:hypothetical protein